MIGVDVEQWGARFAGALRRVRTLCTFTIDAGTAGQSNALANGSAPQPDHVYLLVSTGPVWVRMDGESVSTRSAPARYCDGWILVAGEGAFPQVAADDDVAVDVITTIEGPLDNALVEYLGVRE